MNPLQIHYFLQVAHYRNITLASSEMHVSQPAVSKQILALERELEVDLFDRSGKRLTLTKSGELYYHFFVHTLTEFEDLKRLAKDVSRQPCPEEAAESWLLPLPALRRHPPPLGEGKGLRVVPFLSCGKLIPILFRCCTVSSDVKPHPQRAAAESGFTEAAHPFVFPFPSRRRRGNGKNHKGGIVVYAAPKP